MAWTVFKTRVGGRVDGELTEVAGRHLEAAGGCPVRDLWVAATDMSCAAPPPPIVHPTPRTPTHFADYGDYYPWW